MPKTSPSYRAIVRAGTAIATLLGLFDAKLRAGHLGRRHGGKQLEEWARLARDPARPLVWLHASSVGEGLQAESVLEELRRLRPDAQLVYTHFSPSAEPLARRLRADAADYLPYDLPGESIRLLEALRPDLLVFSKLDLWPELATRAAARGTTVAIVAGTVSAGSGRLRWPARRLLAPGYASVSAAGAVAEADAGRLAVLGVPRTAIRVLGDPRFDSVELRVRSTSPDDPLLRLGSGAPSLVAGSTWPGDEAALLAAFAAVLAERPLARLVIVPHEPDQRHLAELAALAARLVLPQPVLLSVATGPEPLLVVDRVGALAALYGAGTMAYVGGGFGRAGLHSVLEPAAWGVPVAFGPRWQESRDAGLLLSAEAAATVNGAESLAEIWMGWLGDESRRAAMGARARTVVQNGLGAARRSAEMLAELISSRPLRTSQTGGRSVPP
ncbi:MAG: 3-deoxy-D-manno-octulosonic acid transferase [Gemmatimonadales bacterium]